MNSLFLTILFVMSLAVGIFVTGFGIYTIIETRRRYYDDFLRRRGDRGR